MNKGVKICIAVVAVIFVCSAIMSFLLLQKSDGRYVEIVQDNEILYRIDMMSAENQTIRIDGKNGGYNIIEISDGTIRICDADCPDRTCVNTGVLSDNMPIVCLPHKLVIRYSYED